MAINASDAALLEWFGSVSDVAALRAVQPTAMTLLVLTSFGILYIPFVARLYARGNHADVSRRYWQTANWIMILTLPVLVMCLLFNQEFTTRLLGEDYADSAILLGVLAGGYYINAMFGFNGMTLNVYRKIGFLVGINGIALATNIGLNVILIPRVRPPRCRRWHCGDLPRSQPGETVRSRQEDRVTRAGFRNLAGLCDCCGGECHRGLRRIWAVAFLQPTGGSLRCAVSISGGS